MSDAPSFLIVDDHPVIGFAMNLLISKHFPKATIDKVNGGKECLQIIKKEKYDLIILDVNLPDYDVLDLIPNIFRNNEDQKILMFTMTPENILAKRLFSLNVMGFLSKNVGDEEIISAIRKVLSGTRYLSEGFSRQMIDDYISGKNSINPFETLSDREYQILTQILSGYNTKTIGENMSLHHSSVNTYRTRIYAKLNIENQMQLFEKAKAFGVI
jgi:DNA-binding NarL/FixJ family response regulator